MSEIDTVDYEKLSEAIFTEGFGVDPEDIAHVTKGLPRGCLIDPRHSRKLVTHKGSALLIDWEADSFWGLYESGSTLKAEYFGVDSERAQEYHKALVRGNAFTVHGLDQKTERISVSSHRLLRGIAGTLLPVIVAVKYNFDQSGTAQTFSRALALTGATLEPLTHEQVVDAVPSVYAPHINAGKPGPLQ